MWHWPRPGATLQLLAGHLWPRPFTTPVTQHHLSPACPWCRSPLLQDPVLSAPHLSLSMGQPLPTGPSSLPPSWGLTPALQPDMPGHGPPPRPSTQCPPASLGLRSHMQNHGPQPEDFCSSNRPSCPQNPFPPASQKAQGPAGCRGKPRGADTQPPSPDLQTLLPSGRGPSPPQETECGARQGVCGALPPWSSSPGGRGWSQDQGLEGQKHLPALPGHVQSHDAQAETITVVSGSLMTRPGPHEGPRDGTIYSMWRARGPRLPSLRGAGQMLAQTRSAHSCPGSSCDDVTQAAPRLLSSGPCGLWAQAATGRPGSGWGLSLEAQDSQTHRGMGWTQSASLSVTARRRGAESGTLLPALHSPGRAAGPP